METKVKPKLDPYAKIRKVPLVGTDGLTLQLLQFKSIQVRMVKVNTKKLVL